MSSINSTIGATRETQAMRDAKAGKASAVKKADASQASDGLGKAMLQGMGASATPETKNAFAALQVLGGHVGTGAQIVSALGSLAEAWGAHAPLAKPAAVLSTNIAALESRPASLCSALSREDIHALTRGDENAFSLGLAKILEQKHVHAPLSALQEAALAPLMARLRSNDSADAPPKTARMDGGGGSVAAGAATDRAITSIDGGRHEGEDDQSNAEGEELKGFCQTALCQLPDMSIEDFVQLVLMQSSTDAEKDTREILKNIQATNKKKQDTRAFISDQKSKSAAIEAALRAEYDRRCKLPEDDLEHIAEQPSFDAFKVSQAIVQSCAGGFDADGKTTGIPTYTVSKNHVLYAQPVKKVYDDNGQAIPPAWVDEAKKLKIDPAVCKSLHHFYSANPVKFVKFARFEEWVLAHPASGGAGLELEPKAAQNDAAKAYLARMSGSLAQATFSAVTDETLSARAKALAEPVFRAIVQPAKQAVDGTEITFAGLQANIGTWQNRLDGLGDISQEQAIKLQMAQARSSKMMEVLSNLMKAISQSAGEIVGNMK